MDEKCIVCFEKINEKMVDVVATKCRHWFHVDCLKKWLGERNTCPYCRFDLKYFFTPRNHTDEEEVLRKLDTLRYKYELLIKLIRRNAIE